MIARRLWKEQLHDHLLFLRRDIYIAVSVGTGCYGDLVVASDNTAGCSGFFAPDWYGNLEGGVGVIECV